MTSYDAVIVGGGACGLMCAVQAGFLGKKVAILERNSKVGAKILISGGGRCNYTNIYTSAANFLSENNHFCKSALAQFTAEDTISFFETYGISPAEKTLGQLFPEHGNARDIVGIFQDLCRDLDQTILVDAEVRDVDKTDPGFRISYFHDNRLKWLESPKVVIASGGLPVRKLGASDFALRLAKKFGLRIVETAPALVPLTITGKDAGWYSKLSGNTIYAEVSNDRISFRENILFTHWGLSGPAILQISTYWRPGEVIYINLLPDHQLSAVIGEQRSGSGGRLLKNLLYEYFTRKFVDSLADQLPLDTALGNLTKDQINQITELVHRFKVRPAGDKGYDKAEVMRGGVDTSELSSKTLEAKKVPGLYFGGECVDVTGWLGGYNFQWAWSSAYIMARDL